MVLIRSPNCLLSKITQINNCCDAVEGYEMIRRENRTGAAELQPGFSGEIAFRRRVTVTPLANNSRCQAVADGLESMDLKRETNVVNGRTHSAQGAAGWWRNTPRTLAMAGLSRSPNTNSQQARK